MKNPEFYAGRRSKGCGHRISFSSKTYNMTALEIGFLQSVYARVIAGPRKIKSNLDFRGGFRRIQEASVYCT